MATVSLVQLDFGSCAMAMGITNGCPRPLPHFFRKSGMVDRQISERLSLSCVSSINTSLRCSHIPLLASSSSRSPDPISNDNPYKVLGVTPMAGFDKIKSAYIRKQKDAKRRGDEAYANQLESAYEKIMMLGLANRKKGLVFGSFQVSKDIKYADKQPLLPWGPRFSKSSDRDVKINLAISALFTAWVLIIRNAEYKPLQFLAFVFVYRIFEKLKASEQASPRFTEEGVETEDEGRAIRMGKRLLRSLALVFSCVAISSLAYTGLLNLIELLGHYIPASLYNNQELIVTAVSALLLQGMVSYYR